MEQGNLAGALEHFDEALRLAPEDADVHSNRAALMGRLGREADAVESYRKALRLGDRSPRVLNNLAWLLASAREPRLRAPAEAVALAQEAVETTGGEEPQILDTLSVALATAGRHGEARETALRALALAETRGDEPLARSIRARLAAGPGS
jgi:Flp pilus assembly protein TadD